MIEEYTCITKQSWDLSKWLKSKLEEKQAQGESNAKDKLVEAHL